MENILTKIGQSFESLISNLSGLMESSVPGFVLVILGIVVAFVVELLFRFLFKIIKIDAWFEKAGVQRMLRVLNIKYKPHRIVSMVIFFAVFLFFLDAIADVSGWKSVTSNIKDVLSFIPLLFGGILILLIGRMISNLVKKSIKVILSKSGAASANVLSKVAYYVLLAVSLTLAISFMGVNTSIITANFSIILGSLLLSFALAFAFASRNILKNILSSSYNRNNFKVGQKVSISGNEGEIIKITNISVIIKTEEKIQVIPATHFTERIVEILG